MKLLSIISTLVQWVCMVGFLTGDFDAKLWFAGVFGMTAIASSVAIAIQLRSIYLLALSSSAFAFLAFWTALIAAPEYFFGYLSLYQAHYLFVTVFSGFQLSNCVVFSCLFLTAED